MFPLSTLLISTCARLMSGAPLTSDTRTVSEAVAPLPPEVLAARQLTNVKPLEGGETLFGEDLISEKSLDEVILAYLAGETDSK